jgi:hypothetical protein
MQAKPQQLISAARLLKEAQDLVGDVETIMSGAGCADMAQRLKEIAGMLRDELHELRQLMGRKP